MSFACSKKKLNSASAVKKIYVINLLILLILDLVRVSYKLVQKLTAMLVYVISRSVDRIPTSSV